MITTKLGTRLTLVKMGILALVDYGLIKEICDQVKKDKKSFVGKVKANLPQDEGSACENSKVNHVKRLLLSGKRKSDSERNKKRKGKIPKAETVRFRQHSSDSDTGSSSGTNSETSEDSDSEHGGESIDSTKLTVPKANIK